MSARPSPAAEEARDETPSSADPVALEQLRREALAGLTAATKELPPKLFYDERGSALFEQITTLEAYYPTRTERAIIDAHAAEMAALIGPKVLLIEYGSGSSSKTRLLLDELEDPVAYVPIDISRAHLLASASALREEYLNLEVLPLSADYTSPLALPEPNQPPRRRAVFFPGSTIGNFHPPEAESFLARVADTVGPGGALLIGVDLDKDVSTLERAYNDPQGVTAAFNLNVLARLNRELDAGFDLEAFRHRARYNIEQQRIEMRLASLRDQTVHVAGQPIHFARGETILTECSYKYRPDQFAALAARAGWSAERVWTDPDGLFSVHYLEVAE